MVHDEVPSDMWWHDTMGDFSIISNGHPVMKMDSRRRAYLSEIKPCIIHQTDPITRKMVPVDWNADKRTALEQRLKLVEESERKLKSKFKEAHIEDGYRASTGIITPGEQESTRVWYENGLVLINEVSKNYRMFRGYKDMSDEEYNILYDEITRLIKLLRETIRDRYVFARAVEKRIGLR